MIQASVRVPVGDDFYRRETEMFEAEPLVGDGIAYGDTDDLLVLSVAQRLHVTRDDDPTDVALLANVLSHAGDDPAFALLGHGFAKEQS